MPHIQTSSQEPLKLGFGDYTCNWGVHICGFYETEEERDLMLMGFLNEGDIAGDLQLYCPYERSVQGFHDDYQRLFPDCKAHTHDKSKFQLLETKDLYYPNGTFSPLAMDEGLNAFYRKSQENGKINVRATAEMSWALEAIPGVEHLMVYESRLNYFIPDKPWISICLYNVAKFDGQTIMQALQTHPYTVTNGVIVENPYYIDPDKWLNNNAPEFLLKK